MHLSASSRVFLVIALATASSGAHAQRNSDYDDDRWLDNCRNGNWNGGDDRGRACEVRVVPVRLSGRTLAIDGRENGGVRVVAWDGDSVRVTARMQANARDDRDAAEMLTDIRIVVDGAQIRADGPTTGRREGWGVSYMVFVPRRFDLRLDASNGGLSVTGVTGSLDLRTVNGSVSLTDAGGDVRARTQNGSVNVQLAGAGWDGRGLDAETQNGSVRLGIPRNYAAQIETGTVNGRVNTDFPITVQGRIGRHLSVPLNGGGKVIRATTTNGSVTLATR